MQAAIESGAYIEYISLIAVLALVGAVRTFTPNKSRVNDNYGILAHIFVNIIDTIITGTCTYAAMCVYLGVPFPLNTFIAIAIGWLGLRGTYGLALQIVNVITKYKGNHYEHSAEQDYMHSSHSTRQECMIKKFEDMQTEKAKEAKDA